MPETEPDVGTETLSADDLQLIVPNLHRRYSGVTATNRMVAPKLANLFNAAWLGPDAPEGIARMGFSDLAKLWRRSTPLIWHARRNNEMIVGVALRALGWPFRLVFTSAAQRHHTWITRWLIRRMDAIIATNDISASFLKREATVIPHGVDTDTYAPPADRAAALAEAGLPCRYAVGCFGRVRAQKGSDVFVDAMCRLLPRYPDFVAVMVGAITPEQSGFANGLKQRIEAAGLGSRMVVSGELPIEEVRRWYRRRRNQKRSRPPIVAKIFSGVDREHSRPLGRRRHVDAFQPAMSVFAAHERHVQHAFNLHVVHEEGASGEQPRVLIPQDAGAKVACFGWQA